LNVYNIYDISILGFKDQFSRPVIPQKYSYLQDSHTWSAESSCCAGHAVSVAEMYGENALAISSLASSTKHRRATSRYRQSAQGSRVGR